MAVRINKSRLLVYAGVLVTSIMLPFVVRDPYFIGIVNFIVTYCILCLGLNLILGYTGLLSLGHAAFYGIGAYATAILMTKHGFGFLHSLAISGLLAFLL